MEAFQDIRAVGIDPKKGPSPFQLVCLLGSPKPSLIAVTHKAPVPRKVIQNNALAKTIFVFRVQRLEEELRVTAGNKGVSCDGTPISICWMEE